MAVIVGCIDHVVPITSFQLGDVNQLKFQIPVKSKLVAINKDSPDQWSTQNNTELIQKFYDKQKKKKSSIAVELQFSADFRTLTITVESEVLKVLREVMFRGEEMKTEELSLKATIKAEKSVGRGSNAQISFIDFTLENLKMRPGSDGTVYEQMEADFPKDRFSTFYNIQGYYYLRCWEVKLTVSTDNFVCFEEYERKGTFGESLFNIGKYALTGNCSDFTIIAMGGEKISCYKIFLCANSRVFSNMLNGDYKEKTEAQVDMQDVTPPAVRAMLEYFYIQNVGPIQIPSVALELFIAADKYEFQDLEKLTKRILLGKGHKWYDIETALKLFQFATKYTAESAKDLRRKAAQILAKKSEELERSTMFQELFPTQAGRDMFATFLADMNKI